jgi:hypothetical protein
VIIPLEQAPGDLLKPSWLPLLGSTFSKNGVEPMILHFSQACRWCWCCCPWTRVWESLPQALSHLLCFFPWGARDESKASVWAASPAHLLYWNGLFASASPQGRRWLAFLQDRNFLFSFCSSVSMLSALSKVVLTVEGPHKYLFKWMNEEMLLVFYLSVLFAWNVCAFCLKCLCVSRILRLLSGTYVIGT